MSRITTAVSPLRDARLTAGMTQTALSEQTNRSQAFISRIENGTVEGSREFYDRAADVLGCTAADLIRPGFEPQRSRKREE